MGEPGRESRPRVHHQLRAARAREPAHEATLRPAQGLRLGHERHLGHPVQGSLARQLEVTRAAPRAAVGHEIASQDPQAPVGAIQTHVLRAVVVDDHRARHQRIPRFHAQGVPTEQRLLHGAPHRQGPLLALGQLAGRRHQRRSSVTTRTEGQRDERRGDDGILHVHSVRERGKCRARHYPRTLTPRSARRRPGPPAVEE